MKPRERTLRHQIHPAQLAVDWGFGALSLIAFWNHEPLFGLLLAIVPSVCASYLIRTYMDPALYTRTPFGRYMAHHMSIALRSIRLTGFLCMIFGAWAHDLVVVLLGFAVMLLAWLSGFFAARARSVMRTMRPPHRAPSNLPR